MQDDLWRELLLPKEEENDPRFRAQVEELSVLGLRIIAAVCLSGAIYFVVTGIFLPQEMRHQIGGVVVPAVVAFLGVVGLGASFWERAKAPARWVGLGVGYGVAVTEFFGTASIADRPEIGYFLFSGIVTGVMLIGIAALPLKPLHVLTLGAAIAVTYRLAMPFVAPSLGGLQGQLLFVGQVVLLCTALTAVVYRQRVLAYRAQRSARESLEALRQAQARLLVSESAHAQSRLAAALSHELNTPLGALSSAFDTLLSVCRREGLAERGVYGEIVTGAEKAGKGSAIRIQRTLERMRFLSNLDRAEEQWTDLNELCRETVAAMEGELSEKAEAELDLAPLPELRCRPQQVGAVIATLLRYAAAASDGRGRISLKTRAEGKVVVLEVSDTGPGLTREEVGRLFEPAFGVRDGRVAAVNWGFVVSRAIVADHGGQLDVESAAGRGTTTRVVLPMSTPKKSG